MSSLFSGSNEKQPGGEKTISAPNEPIKTNAKECEAGINRARGFGSIHETTSDGNEEKKLNEIFFASLLLPSIIIPGFLWQPNDGGMEPHTRMWYALGTKTRRRGGSLT